MKTKLTIVTLGVMATLVLGNLAPAGATNTKTDTKPEVTKEKVVTKEPAPEVVVEEPAPKVVVEVKSGDTLDAIATEHGTTYVRLFDANPSITHPDVIDVGNKITIPAADKVLEDRFSHIVPAAPSVAMVEAAPAPSVATVDAAATTYTTQEYTSAPVNSNSYYVGNGMWCTDYVHSKRPDVAIYGNAGYNWISSAQAAGKSTGSTPQAGAVAVMDGHVAYVESVNPDGSYTVSEMGWNYQAGNYNQRTVQPGAFGSFIY